MVGITRSKIILFVPFSSRFGEKSAPSFFFRGIHSGPRGRRFPSAPDGQGTSSHRSSSMPSCISRDRDEDGVHGVQCGLVFFLNILIGAL